MVNEHGVWVARGTAGGRGGRGVEVERCFSRGLLNTAGLIGKTVLYRTTTSSHWPREYLWPYTRCLLGMHARYITRR